MSIKFSELTKRRFRYGTNSIFLMVAVIVVIVVINIVVGQFQLSIDVSQEGLYTISDITDKKLKNLDQDVTITVLSDKLKAESDTNLKELVRIMNIYDTYDHVTLEYLDITKYPAKLNSLVGEDYVKAYSAGDCVVTCGSRVKQIKNSSLYINDYDDSSGLVTTSTVTGNQIEMIVTGAVILVTSETTPVIYMTSGHSENSFSEDYSTLKALVEYNNYQIVEGLDLSEKDIPEDAAIIISCSPKKDFTAKEYEKVEAWYKSTGGKFIFMMDYDKDNVKYNYINKLFGLFGYSMNNDLMTDFDKGSTNDSNIIFTMSLLPDGSPLENMAQTPLLIPYTRSFTKLSISDNLVENFSLAQTLETAVSNSVDPNVKYPDGVCDVMVAANYFWTEKPSRIFITGTSQFFTDAYLQEYNEDVPMQIFVKAVTWLYYGESEADSISVKTYNADKITVTKDQAQKIGWFSILIYPVVILSIGIVVWARRRHL